MHNIELYVGDARGRVVSERVVLSRVVEWLTAHNVPAVIFHDIVLNGEQIDLLVGTEITTLQLEVKSFRGPVSGKQNGDWRITRRDGTTFRCGNGYRQTLTNNQTLRDEMSRFHRYAIDVGYPSGAVLFEPEIPSGSNLDIRKDKRVVICGTRDLGTLLSTPGVRPWPLAWLREFAQSQLFIRAPLPIGNGNGSAAVFRAPWPSEISIDKHLADGGDVRVAGALVTSSTNAYISPLSAVVSVDVTEATELQGDRSNSPGSGKDGFPSESNGGPGGRKRLAQLLFRHLPVLLSLVAVVYAFTLHTAATPKEPPGTPVSKLQSAYVEANHKHAVRRAHPKASRKHREHLDDGASGDVGNVDELPASQNPGLAVEDVQPAVPITCPAGVDRLGCNGPVGVQSMPDCPDGFIVSGDSCVRSSSQ
jgi:hypothetical protein